MVTAGIVAAYSGPVAVCDLCGAMALDERGTVPPERDVMPLTWVTSTENGKRRVYCDRCSREHLRSIEAKLDSEWW